MNEDVFCLMPDEHGMLVVCDVRQLAEHIEDEPLFDAISNSAIDSPLSFRLNFDQLLRLIARVKHFNDTNDADAFWTEEKE